MEISNIIGIPELDTNHEEADTKIAYLIVHAINNYSGAQIVVRSRSGDVDIPVILTGLFGSSTTRIIVDNGTGKHRKNIRIDASSLSKLQRSALIGFHGFSGNDFVESFLRKTKKVWEIVRDDQESLTFFDNLGVVPLDENLFAASEKFVCRMYGDKKCSSVNKLRCKMFWNHYRKNGKVPDLSLLPPCASSLKKHTSRAYFVAKVWKQAHFPVQDTDSFANFGWLSDGAIDWIDEAYPDNVNNLFNEGAPTEDPSDEEVEEEDSLDDESDIENEDDEEE